VADRTAADEGERLEEPSPVTPQEVEVDEREATEAEHDPTAETAPLHADEEEDPVVRAEAEGQEYLALAKRTQADFENYRKRAAKDLTAAGERARTALVRELLPVVDNLERALAAATEAEQSLAHGVQLVLGELAGVLTRAGVESFEPGGEAFDPKRHEAISTRTEEGSEAGLVLDVVQKGYRSGDTILRPARVVVSA